MAAPPSLSIITTPSQAFAYPLPTVRAFHKQLQTALDEKNNRLRTLVGGSYRQLLGTAETIVSMRRDIESVEGKLARVAEGCGRGVVGKKVLGLGKLSGGSGPGGKDGAGVRDGGDNGEALGLSWVARMKVLDGCVLVVGRLLRGKDSPSSLSPAEQQESKSKGPSLVLAAKVLVLARLLIKSLSDEVKTQEGGATEGSDGLLEDMRRKLGALRRRLLRAVERILVKIDGDKDREDLSQALCAYSLATSSGAKDVIRHFLHIRGEAMALEFSEDDGDGESSKKGNEEERILRALGLYTRTLLDAQALVPRQLSDALLSLKGKPLLEDESIRGLEGLRLDVSEKWFGDEILFFTPYIRHDELNGLQAGEMLKGWAKKASEVLLRGFEKTLALIVEFKRVVELRSRVFEGWISGGGKARGFDSSVMLDGLRKVVNERLVNLLETRIAKLHLVGTEIEAVLDSWTAGLAKTQSSLWSDEFIEMELTGGAGGFKQAIIAGVHGRNNSVSRVVKGHETWRYLIDELVTSIEQLRNQRWDDDIDSLEDDEVLEERNTLLSKDDPQMLQDHLDEFLENAYKNLHQKISTLLTAHKDSEHLSGIVVFILRILRDIRIALPKRPDLKSFGISIIPELHNTLATSVSSGAIESFTICITGRKKVTGRALWEGTPELPVHPSPSAFRFLHSLTFSMTTAGSDLWSLAAVSALKRHVRDKLSQEWSQALKKYNNTEKVVQANGHRDKDAEKEENIEAKEEEPNGTENAQDIHADGVAKADPAEPDQSLRQEILIQSLFDVYLLQHALLLPGVNAPTFSSKDSLSQLNESLKAQVIGLTDSSVPRLQRSAEEYWKRTSLLFGLLV